MLATRVALITVAWLAGARGFAPRRGAVRAAANQTPLRAKAAAVERPRIVFESKGREGLDRETKQLLDQGEAVGVTQVNDLEGEVEALSLVEMRQRVAALKDRLATVPLDAEPSDADVAETFALVREAAWRVLRLRAYDVQLLGGYVMGRGKLVEMATGEGKTLAAIAPTVLGALRGRGALVVTANDYLARRDADSVGQVVRYLGLTVGLVESTLKPGSADRREAYAADVTYVSNQELGFDYLRDQLVLDAEELVLPERDSTSFSSSSSTSSSSLSSRTNALFYWCLVDEADSILIDEARTPLIISEQMAAPAAKYAIANDLAREILREGLHYEKDEKAQSVTLTEEGFKEAELVIGKSIWDPADPWAPFVVGAVRAHALLQRDRDYIVDGKRGVSIVDAFSGRVLEGRRWSDGLQQAVEAKEGLEASAQTRPAATVTFQSLFRNVAVTLAGMTGTALTDGGEFDGVYGLKAVPIPTALPVGRKDYDDAVYRTVEAKLRAAAAEVARAHKTGRPVLVGTTSVDDSDAFVQRLRDGYGIEAAALNARPDVAARESAIVAQAGRLGAVTVATNMAGRGTDIVLGGNSKDLAKMCVEAALLDATEAATFAQRNGLEALSAATVATLEAATSLAVAELGDEGGALGVADAKDLVALAAEKAPTSNAIVRAARTALDAVRGEFDVVLDRERLRVLDAGGLYVIGTERHESRRIDQQLRGRAGRQGDPGASRFFVSVEDRLFRTFGGDRLESLMRNFRIGDDLPLEARSVTEALTAVQARVEAYNAEIRSGVLRFDNVLDLQRRATYAMRRQLLVAGDADATQILREWTRAAAAAVVDSVARDATTDAASTTPSALLHQRLAHFFGAHDDLTVDFAAGLLRDNNQKSTASSSKGSNCPSALAALLDSKLDSKLDAVAAARPSRSAPRSFAVLALMRTDTQWAQHLTNMDYLKDSVQLRVYAQQDPFQEFVLESNTLFNALTKKIKTDTVYSFFQLS